MKLHRYVEHQRLHILSKDRHPYRDTSESTSLNGFHQYRQDSKVHTNQNQRTPYGMALYTSEKLHIDPSSLTSDNIEIMLSEINRT